MVNLTAVDIEEYNKKSQIENELIYSIVRQIAFVPVKYIEGGIYDRLMENFTHNSKMELDPDGEYDWINIPLPNKLLIFLALPGEEPKYVRLNQNERWAKPKYGYTNIKLINLYYYRSAINKNIQGVTFGDLNNIIKPIKILEHKWEQMSVYSDNQWKCKKCGMVGYSNPKDPSILLPSEYITCDEKIIRNIIL